MATINKSYKLISSSVGDHLCPQKHEIILGQFERSGENIGIVGDVLSR